MLPLVISSVPQKDLNRIWKLPLRGRRLSHAFFVTISCPMKRSCAIKWSSNSSLSWRSLKVSLSCPCSLILQINALRDEDLNENFFKALAHVQEIHANCKVLLRTHHQVIISPYMLSSRYVYSLASIASIC